MEKDCSLKKLGQRFQVLAFCLASAGHVQYRKTVCRHLISFQNSQILVNHLFALGIGVDCE